MKHHHNGRNQPRDELTQRQIDGLQQIVAAWYARNPRAAAQDAFEMTMELTRNGEIPMALDELPIRLRMHDIRLTRDEHTFLTGLVRGVPDAFDEELLDAFDEQLDLWADG